MTRSLTQDDLDGIKARAEAARAIDGGITSLRAYSDYHAAVSPNVALALVAEIKQLQRRVADLIDAAVP